MFHIINYMNTKTKIFCIYRELKKYNDECLKKELIQAAKDLIKFSKDDYINKSETQIVENNIETIDEYLEKKNQIREARHLMSLEDEIILEENEFYNFNNINRAA